MAKLRSIACTSLVLWFSACLGGDAGDGAAASADCRRAVAKLRSCEVFSDGVADQCEVESEGDRAINDCISRCITDSSCEQLEVAVCSGGHPLLSDSGAACINACVDQFSFRCGDGEVLPPDWVCDGEHDCSDGEDESSCSEADLRAVSFLCDDGERVPDSWQCDGEPDCDDGSDEVGCPSFRCDDGETLPVAWECDGETDCEDGSDERGCPERAEFLCRGESLGFSSGF
ncbi:MAG: LDL receptor domain-containing protein [Myxococcales bacterium]|nr:LDL receptor domain-containing protein [Myxococcales bacterium]